MKRFAALILILLLCCPLAAGASGTWYSFTEDAVPREDLGFLVQEYTGTVTITFLGDCTLGGEEKTKTAWFGFVQTVGHEGFAYPFRNLLSLTGTDDLTVANLEGVLSDRDLPKVKKKYNFIGPTAFTEILREGSVECVTIANNHSHDYDTAGYKDTQSALTNAGIAFFGTDSVAVWKNSEGLLIGFLGVSGSLSGNRAVAYRKKAELLKTLGCSAIITVMHAGTEYQATPDGYQNQIVKIAVESGSSLIIGHHPHIVQGYSIVDGVPVVYSLGNCSFGGNGNPRDYDALVVRAELAFEEGELASETLRFFPISISGDSRRNNYSPVFLKGEDAARVLKKMEDSTGVSPGEFDEEKGAGFTVPAP
ncbi:MAG: CapA family protein [Clostridia bacterium]|nr:CapA family protein [Clostridia bacterium]